MIDVLCTCCSLVPRPPRPAFVTCSIVRKAGRRPGRFCHEICATTVIKHIHSRQVCSSYDRVRSNQDRSTARREPHRAYPS